MSLLDLLLGPSEKGRHRKIMQLAETLVCREDREARDAWLADKDAPPAVTPSDLVALAFGRRGLRLKEEEAAEYLAAARVSIGRRAS